MPWQVSHLDNCLYPFLQSSVTLVCYSGPHCQFDSRYFSPNIKKKLTNKPNKKTITLSKHICLNVYCLSLPKWSCSFNNSWIFMSIAWPSVISQTQPLPTPHTNPNSCPRGMFLLSSNMQKFVFFLKVKVLFNCFIYSLWVSSIWVFSS